MKRTTIFVGDELREQLRNEVFRARISMAELIRARLAGSKDQPERRRLHPPPTTSFWKSGESLWRRG